jgi:hypothetical protein
MFVIRNAPLSGKGVTLMEVAVRGTDRFLHNLVTFQIFHSQ